MNRAPTSRRPAAAPVSLCISPCPHVTVSTCPLRRLRAAPKSRVPHMGAHLKPILRLRRFASDVCSDFRVPMTASMT